MKDKKENIQDNSEDKMASTRRNFLRIGMAVGAGAIFQVILVILKWIQIIVKVLKKQQLLSLIPCNIKRTISKSIY